MGGISPGGEGDCGQIESMTRRTRGGVVEVEKVMKTSAEGLTTCMWSAGAEGRWEWMPTKRTEESLMGRLTKRWGE